MVNPASSTPFCEETLKASSTTLPGAGRSGHCAVSLTKENPHTTIASRHLDPERIFNSLTFDLRTTRHSYTLLERPRWKRSNRQKPRTVGVGNWRSGQFLQRTFPARRVHFDHSDRRRRAEFRHVHSSARPGCFFQ